MAIRSGTQPPAEKKQEVHRPGVYKQQNKAHKHGRHRTKNQIDTANKGKVPAKVITRNAKHELKRLERRNQANQIRTRKREELLSKKRGFEGQEMPPLLIAIIPLAADANPEQLLTFIKECDDDAEIIESSNGLLHLNVPRYKHRFTFLTCLPDNIYSMMDVAKVADTVLFLYSIQGIDSCGKNILSALFAQGLPTTVQAALCGNSIPVKKRGDIKRNLTKTIEKSFPKEKLNFIEKSSDVLLLLRQLGSQKQRDIFFRSKRAHMLAEKIDYQQDTENAGTLKISGYVRGQPLSVHQLVHLPYWGTYQLSQIDVHTDPIPKNSSTHKLNKVHALNQVFKSMNLEPVRSVLKANPALQEPLEAENIPDSMDGEQTWPDEEELREAEEIQKAKKILKKVPKGTSEYQAAWILESDDEKEISDNESEPEEMNDSEFKIMETDELDESEDESLHESEDYETMTITDGDDEVKYDGQIDEEEEEELLLKLKNERLDKQFPDEIDTPVDMPARIRFQKYRGLKSFRTSNWDPKENLPAEYSRIFQFQNFDSTRKRIFAEEKEGAMVGWYVTLHIADFPSELWNSYHRDHLPVVYQPLPHEQKMSVLNMIVKRLPSYTDPIRSKDKLIFHVGCRRFSACPIFSQHTNGLKHKYERFFRLDTVMIATVFAPIVFPPSSVTVFKENTDGSHVLVATGTVLSINPDRIIAKRIILSGHPLKINKKSAVIRYMFFNKEDVLWFKPVEIRTKSGRRGHIKEPLGTHGHMKCYFDGPVRSQDVALMNLYKRVFPKWKYEPIIENPAPNKIDDAMEPTLFM